MNKNSHAPIRKAVIPAAGFGTRFLPFTRAVPKEMIPLVDKPVIQYVVEEAAAAGIKAIIAPAGSLRDADVIKRANELGVALFHAPERIFSHH